ncbi:hypothetical protein [Desulfosporosinus meridiei]|uniref:Uncharacterized protein n=1 Tax=Desulfosporosinus meridiei (strain ATCC BAA-275 / DSM 13257 / KCTC 12902 / NCIMB 13706 / S10) TaxID=768704 RepID=J7J4N4_DESMD|nr:hypothetical protein [Desulfosporosinus meridiei]AFQ46243.1 hypothetical protein Desmer_4437 [Desulfosporosinus meridiei DSM 13257]
MTVKFEGNEFALQVIAKGAFVDKGTYVDSSYLVEATTVCLNHIALNAWIFIPEIATKTARKVTPNGKHIRLSMRNAEKLGRIRFLKRWN